MLHLEARVHLEEEEIAARHQELDRSHADVADLRDQPDRRGLQRGDEIAVQARRRRLFEDLLMPALHRAVAAAQGQDVAVGVGCDLHLDVASAPHLRSMKRVGSPKAERASVAADAKAAASSDASATARMPRPPPPAAALTRSG